MESKFLNVFSVSFTNFKGTPTTDIFRRINVVYINTPFLCPIFSVSEKSNALMTFLTIDPSCPIFVSEGFTHI